MKRYSKLKLSFCEVICSRSCLGLRAILNCRSGSVTKQVELMTKARTMVDDRLDILNIIKMQDDIEILVSLLLSKQQQWFFN